MAYYNDRRAYDLRLFEEPYVDGTSARVRKRADVERKEVELPPEQPNKKDEHKSASMDRPKKERKPKVKKQRRRKSNFFRIATAVIFGLSVAFMVVSIIHGQVQLTELNQQIVDARAELSEQQSIYTQLEMKVDSSISTSVVEEYARDNLDMNKASNSQKEFISLSEGDKAEVSMDSHKSVFEYLADWISSLWS